MKALVISILCLFGASSFAVDGIYLGGRIGQVGLSGRTKTTHNNAIGYGIDVGFRSNAIVDVLIQAAKSNHSADLDLTQVLASAELTLGKLADFGFTVGVGPGLYFFNVANTTETVFGIQGSFGSDVWFDDVVRVGLDFRWHGVFKGSGNTSDNFWTVMLRAGYVFET